MKKKSGKLLLMLCVTLLCTLFLSITALAAEEKGALTAVDGNHYRVAEGQRGIRRDGSG